MTMEPKYVYEILFRRRDIGYGVDEGGQIEGFWTGEIDCWGRRTIRPIDGSAPLYLFLDEIPEAA